MCRNDTKREVSETHGLCRADTEAVSENTLVMYRMDTKAASQRIQGCVVPTQKRSERFP